MLSRSRFPYERLEMKVVLQIAAGVVLAVVVVVLAVVLAPAGYHAMIDECDPSRVDTMSEWTKCQQQR